MRSADSRATRGVSAGMTGVVEILPKKEPFSAGGDARLPYTAQTLAVSITWKSFSLIARKVNPKV